ncbi:hypothetical protein BDV09DRAFT_167606 [Aspergillus tetrazonus]
MMAILPTNRLSVTVKGPQIQCFENELITLSDSLPHALFPSLVITSTESSDSHADVQYAGTARRDPRRSSLTLKLEPARLSPESADGVVRVPTICRWRVSRGLEANEGLNM